MDVLNKVMFYEILNMRVSEIYLNTNPERAFEDSVVEPGIEPRVEPGIS